MIAAAACLGLASCAGGPTPEQIAASDDAQCQSYGYAPGEYGYGQCRMQIDQGRQQRRAAIAAAYLGAGGGQMHPYVLPMPQALPPSEETNCNISVTSSTTAAANCR